MLARACECGKDMEAVVVEYLPVPEDHYVGMNIQLTCPACKKCRVVHFYPRSSIDYDAFENLRLPIRINDRVKIANQKIYNLVCSYERFPMELNINRITKILKHLQVEDFLLLYAELIYLEETWCGEKQRVAEKKSIDIIKGLIKIVEKKKIS